MRRIFNFQFSIFKKGEGFTLLELVIVIGVIIGVAGVLSGITAFSLRSANKTTVLTAVNQNGDYAINQIAQSVKFAKSFRGVSIDGNNYVTDCTAVSGTNYTYLRVRGFDGGTTTYICNYTNPPVVPIPNIAVQTVTATPVTLLDTSVVQIANSGAACSFTCSQNTSIDPPTIGISFSLQQQSGSTLVENAVIPVSFQTSIEMRNSLIEK